MNLEINGDMNISQYGCIYIIIIIITTISIIITVSLYYIRVYIYDSYYLSLDHGTVSITL